MYAFSSDIYVLLSDLSFFLRQRMAAPSVGNETGHGPSDIFVHGWVYDIENGEVMDLDVSVGPPGKEVPKTLFRKLAA